MSLHPYVQRPNILSARDGDAIHIFIRDCRVNLRVGVYSTEMHEPQPVVINIELDAALPHHYHDRTEKKLDRVIDYEPIYQFIQNDLTKMEHSYLLETVAEHILDFCFQDIRVRKVRVRIEKTAVFLHAAGAGIEMTRTRPSSPHE